MNGAGASFSAQALGWESSQKRPDIMSSYLNHTENSTWKAAGSEIRNRSAAGLAPSLVAAGFSQPVFVVSHPHLPFCIFHFFFLFWFLAQSFWGIFKNSQDPVCLLTSNYSYAELFRNEMSSNKQCMPTDLYAIWLFCQLMAFCTAAALQAVHIRCVGLCYPCFLHLLQNDLL